MQTKEVEKVDMKDEEKKEVKTGNEEKKPVHGEEGSCCGSCGG